MTNRTDAPANEVFDRHGGTFSLRISDDDNGYWRMHEPIRDITLCILLAWMLGLSAHFFRQPLILAYLIAGFLIGPFGLGW